MNEGSRSGGGISHSGPGTNSRGTSEGMRAFRSRWPSGVAILTIAHDGGFRGVTVSALLPLSVDPPTLAVALQRDSLFHHSLEPGTRVGISILDRQQEFLAERFAGRAPVPDPSFTGVPHRVVEGIPLLNGSIGWCLASVERMQDEGDHLLVIASSHWFELPPDTDDPMILYETRYRGLDIA